MSLKTVALAPVDAWFFRDGRPYHQGESGQADARSHFPPFAPTLVGLVRSSLAMSQGWDGKGRWDHSLNEILGDGFESLGRLQFSGPFVQRPIDQGSGRGHQYLLPAPSHLLGFKAREESRNETTWTPVGFLRPSEQTTLCDLGSIRLPVRDVQIQKSQTIQEPQDCWMTVEGYEIVLRGKLPPSESVVHADNLWKAEPRVGLARDHETRLAEDGKLYSPHYVRLKDGVRLVTGVTGVPEGWLLPGLVSFGGEGRMAYCDGDETPLPLPNVPVEIIRETRKFTATLLTPLSLPEESSGYCQHPLPGTELPGLSGSRIVSASVGKPLQIGGWNSLERKPLPLRAYLPAGSTWFCEADATAIDGILNGHGKYLGERTQYGFGQIALGLWPSPHGVSR